MFIRSCWIPIGCIHGQPVWPIWETIGLRVGQTGWSCIHPCSTVVIFISGRVLVNVVILAIRYHYIDWLSGLWDKFELWVDNSSSWRHIALSHRRHCQHLCSGNTHQFRSVHVSCTTCASFSLWRFIVWQNCVKDLITSIKVGLQFFFSRISVSICHAKATAD